MLSKLISVALLSLSVVLKPNLSQRHYAQRPSISVVRDFKALHFQFADMFANDHYVVFQHFNPHYAYTMLGTVLICSNFEVGQDINSFLQIFYVRGWSLFLPIPMPTHSLLNYRWKTKIYHPLHTLPSYHLEL